MEKGEIMRLSPFWEQEFSIWPKALQLALSKLSGCTQVDEEDLAFISAHAQDALIRVSDLAYLPKQRRFALICARFDRVAEREGRRERRHAGLHFDGVTGVRRLQINLNQSEQVLALLAVTFEAIKDAPPSGVIRLIFAGGPEIELQVDASRRRCVTLAQAGASMQDRSTILMPVLTKSQREGHDNR